MIKKLILRQLLISIYNCLDLLFIYLIFLYNLINRFTPIKKRQIAKRSNVEALKEKTIETLIVADYSVYNEFENLNENLETYLLSVFNMVSLIYKDPSLGFPIKFSIVKLIIIKNETVSF